MFTNMFTAGDQLILQCPPRPLQMERKWKSNVEVAPNCPRCASPNTKFCYYNNYSLSQPRYFCKGCRRYWTKGGSLRNVPVGGGCRKYRRAKSVRNSQNDRAVSSNYRNSFNGSDSSSNESLSNTCASSIEYSVAQQGGVNGSDIDLAAVFAEFLNQDSSYKEPEFIGQEFPNNKPTELLVNESNCLNPDVGGQNDTLMIESQKPMDLVHESDLLEGQSQVLLGEKQQQEDRNQEFIESDMNAFGLQTLFGDEMVHDALWSDEAACPDVTWQQFQEFDSFFGGHMIS